MAQIMFETFNVPAIYTWPIKVCCLCMQVDVTKVLCWDLAAVCHTLYPYTKGLPCPMPLLDWILLVVISPIIWPRCELSCIPVAWSCKIYSLLHNTSHAKCNHAHMPSLVTRDSNTLGHIPMLACDQCPGLAARLHVRLATIMNPQLIDCQRHGFQLCLY